MVANTLQQAFNQAIVEDQEAYRRRILQLQNCPAYHICVISIDHMDKLTRTSPLGQSASERTKADWMRLKNKLELGATYYPALEDLKGLDRLLKELTGGVFMRSAIQIYGGRPHIVLSGSGLKSFLNQTMYAINDSRVVELGISKFGIMESVKSGAILSIVLITGFRVIDYLLNDNITLSALIGTIATDLAKIAITSGIAIGAGLIASSLPFVSTFVLAPLAIAVVIGFLTSQYLTDYDDTNKITDNFIKKIDNYMINKAKDVLSDSAAQSALGQYLPLYQRGFF